MSHSATHSFHSLYSQIIQIVPRDQVAPAWAVKALEPLARSVEAIAQSVEALAQSVNALSQEFAITRTYFMRFANMDVKYNADFLSPLVGVKVENFPFGYGDLLTLSNAHCLQVIDAYKIGGHFTNVKQRRLAIEVFIGVRITSNTVKPRAKRAAAIGLKREGKKRTTHS